MLTVSLEEIPASLSCLTCDTGSGVNEEVCTEVPKRKAAKNSIGIEPASHTNLEGVVLTFKNKVVIPKRKETPFGILSRLVPSLTTWGESLGEQDVASGANESVAVTAYASLDGADPLVVAHDKSTVFASLEVR